MLNSAAAPAGKAMRSSGIFIICSTPSSKVGCGDGQSKLHSRRYDHQAQRRPELEERRRPQNGDPMRSLVPAAMLVSAVTLAPASAVAADLAIGDAAPDFTLPSTDGSQVTLSSFAGQKNVVLAFFPKAFTAG